MSDPKILVTGANGFLGSEIVRQLHGASLPVRATSLRAFSSCAAVEHLQADIMRTEQVALALKDIDTVIHTAGLAHVFRHASQYEFQRINVNGSVSVMQAAVDQGISHFIFVSSISVYGHSGNSVYREGDPCRPEGPYAQSKLKAEQELTALASCAGAALTILRLSTLYGEGDRGNVNRLMRSIDRGHFIWLGRGDNYKSLLYKRDAAIACMLVAKNPARGIRIFNVSAPACTMKEIVNGLASALGMRIRSGGIPASLALSASSIMTRLHNERANRLGETIKKWLCSDVCDSTLFDSRYQFKARTPLFEGLSRQVACYRQAHRLGNSGLSYAS